MNGDIIPRFGSNDHVAILPLEDVASAIPDEIAVALDEHGQVDDGLDRLVVWAGRVAEVELDIVKVGDDLVHGRGRLGGKLLCEDGLDEEIVWLEEQHLLSLAVGPRRDASP